MDRGDEPVMRAATWLKAWDAHDIHRTATSGDKAGAGWLTREVRQLGATSMIEEFAVEQLDPIAAFIEIEGVRVEGVPIFDSPATGPGGVSGSIGLLGSAARIGVVELSPHAVYAPEYEELRRNSRHEAVAIVCNGTRPGMALLNAERFRTPFGPPGIQVSSRSRDVVWAAVTGGIEVRLVANSQRIPSRAGNVVVMISGREPQRRPVVVMTPRSSWWQSTAERGGGLVCWLETLSALIAAPPAPDVIFTANSGHELGHLGLDAFLACRPTWAGPATQGGALWVHYGANIGAAGGELSIMSAAPDLAALAAGELTRAGLEPGRIAPPDFVPSGETRDIHRAHESYITLVGDNHWFHLPDDRWPHAVDSSATARIAAGAAAMVVTLTR